MSLSRVTELWCDECANWIQEKLPGTALRQVAKNRGWTRGQDGADYCPNCSKRRSDAASAKEVKREPGE